MNTTEITMSNFDGGNSPSFADRVQQMRMDDAMTRSMNTYQLKTLEHIAVPITQVEIKKIRTDGGTHSRSVLNEMIVDEYKEAMLFGDVFPPVTLFKDGEIYWLADGFHTLDAASKAGFETIGAQVKLGTKSDAKFYSARANHKHGQRRTNADKRRSVEMLFEDPQLRLLSDRSISIHCVVDNAFVSKLRNEMVEGFFDSAKSNPSQFTEETEFVDGQQSEKRECSIPTTEIPPQTRDLVRDTVLADNIQEITALSLCSLPRQEQIMKVIAGGEAPTVLEANRALRSQKSAAKVQKRIKDVEESNFNCENFVQGDCLKNLHLLAPKSVRLLLSDVPYGMGFQNKPRVASENSEPIVGDKDIKEAVELLRNMLAAIEHAMKEECHVLIFSLWRYEHLFRRVLTRQGYDVRNLLVWVKTQHGAGDVGGFAPQYECIIHAVRGKAKISPRIPNALIVPSEHSTSHDCEKPTELLRQLINCTTVPGELVCDPFAGTAATLVAAAQTQRKYFGVELKPNFHKEGLGRLRDPWGTGSVAPADNTCADNTYTDNTYQDSESLRLLSAA